MFTKSARAKRKDAFPEWKRLQRNRAGVETWRAKKLAQGLCPACGKEPSIKGGRGARCREVARAGARRAYRLACAERRRHDELTAVQYRALAILNRGAAWTPATFKPVMWPVSGNIRGAGRFLSLLANAGWLSREQVAPRRAAYRLNDEGRRMLALNRKLWEEAQKSEAA